MGFAHIKRLTLIAPLFAAMLILAPTIARAEILTLKCFGRIVYIIDLSAKTATGKDQGDTFSLTNVAVSDSTISFVYDRPPSFRIATTIDRTIGSIVSENYWYPQSGINGSPRDLGQCTKIPNNVF